MSKDVADPDILFTCFNRYCVSNPSDNFIADSVYPR